MKRIFYVLILLLFSFPILSQSTVIEIEHGLAELDSLSAGTADSVKIQFCNETASVLFEKEYIFNDLTVLSIYHLVEQNNPSHRIKDEFQKGIRTRITSCYGNQSQIQSILGDYSIDFQNDSDSPLLRLGRGQTWMRCRNEDSRFNEYWIIIPDYNDEMQLRIGQTITIKGKIFFISSHQINCVADEISIESTEVKAK